MMKGRLPRTLSRALGVGWVCSAPPGQGRGSGLPQCPVLHTKPSPTAQCLPPAHTGFLSRLCIPQDVQELQQEPRAYLWEAMASVSPYRLCRL